LGPEGELLKLGFAIAQSTIAKYTMVGRSFKAALGDSLFREQYQTSIDCWAKIPAIAPCDDARVTEGGVRGLARSPAA
jgi:hypothetical protein